MIHLSGSENIVGTNGPIVWPLEFLKGKCMLLIFSRHQKSMKMQIYDGDPADIRRHYF